MDSYTTVIRPLTVHLNDGHDSVLDADLRFHASDPFTIRLTCYTDEAEPVAWCFARDLLADGLRTAAGLGDIHITPAPGNRIVIRLSSPDGTAILDLDRQFVEWFLDATYQLVPSTTECDHLDLDGTIHQLLHTDA